MKRLHQSYQRRLIDLLEEVFHRACQDGNVRTASSLLLVLEDLHARQLPAKTAERRNGEDIVAKARVALDRCRMLAAENAQAQPPPPADRPGKRPRN